MGPKSFLKKLVCFDPAGDHSRLQQFDKYNFCFFFLWTNETENKKIKLEREVFEQSWCVIELIGTRGEIKLLYNVALLVGVGVVVAVVATVDTVGADGSSVVVVKPKNWWKNSYFYILDLPII
jgi:hypothetical protein